MDYKASFDAFKFCWEIIFQESSKCENKFFNAEYCKMFRGFRGGCPRNTSFEVLENRLAYIYIYGCFNISFFEKCFLIYINQCSLPFPYENLKVCSLSNGPGFDIIGLLSALRISNKPLKCFPVFNAINLHESWSEFFKILVCKAYEICIAKSFTEYFDLNQKNINFIQGDIYLTSTLSPEAKKYISNSNVLLIFNVFVSSKATPTTFENSLKAIFTLLHPGSLIFFIGSKNNAALFSKLPDLKLHVKRMFGPQKVTLHNLSVDEKISNNVGIKPRDSGYGNFIVWQKRDRILESTRYEQRSSEDDIIVEYEDDSDNMSDLCSSESSITSSVEDRDETKHGLKLSDKFISSQINSKMTPLNISLNYKISSVQNITSALHDMKLKPVNCDEQKMKICQQNILQSHFNNASKTNNIFPENGRSVVGTNEILKENGVYGTDSSRKSKKNEMQSINKPEDQSLKYNVKDNYGFSKTQEINSLEINSYKSSVETEKKARITSQETTIENLNCTDNSVQSLLQRCDSLISKLEELTIDIKNEFSSSRKSKVMSKTHFCCQQIKDCQITICCGCCVKIVHSCCCRKFCKH